MAKLTIEIDMDDPQEIWDALYRRIEDFEPPELEDEGASKRQNNLPATYDLLFDPEHAFRDPQTFFGIFSRND